MIAVGVNALLFAAAWGDLRSQVRGNKSTSDERHKENRETMLEIRDDVKRINGQVQRHQVMLDSRK